MISVITATYNTTTDQINRLWNSLKQQTYTDWEWIVYDDSPESNMEVFRQICGICLDERYKVNVAKPHVADNRGIGNAKRKAFHMAHGNILVEVDHDDELTPDCLAEIAMVFEDPEVGFVYSDWAEVFPSGEHLRYSEGWGLGYGQEYEVDGFGWVMSMPTINRKTLSHIVSIPNHVRAWSYHAYHTAGGHNPCLRICDDYDLLVRTALTAKCVHIPKPLYIQHIQPDTAQREQNADIQELVPVIHACYAKEINIKYPD